MISFLLAPAEPAPRPLELCLAALMLSSKLAHQLRYETQLQVTCDGIPSRIQHPGGAVASCALLPASPVRQLQAHTSGRSGRPGKYHDEIMDYF